MCNFCKNDSAIGDVSLTLMCVFSFKNNQNVNKRGTFRLFVLPILCKLTIEELDLHIAYNCIRNLDGADVL